MALNAASNETLVLDYNISNELKYTRDFRDDPLNNVDAIAAEAPVTRRVNAAFVELIIDRAPHVALVTIKKVRANEEIIVDHGEDPPSESPFIAQGPRAHHPSWLKWAEKWRILTWLDRKDLRIKMHCTNCGAKRRCTEKVAVKIIENCRWCGSCSQDPHRRISRVVESPSPPQRLEARWPPGY
eukprot:SAG11_NODE_5474_length_1550_cov_66.057202_1_plen_184_part_00